MPSIDLDEEFLKLFYGLTNKTPPANINLLQLKKQAIFAEEYINDLKTRGVSNADKSDNIEENDSEENNINCSNSILVIDDLGVITFQLKVLLSGFGYDVDCSLEIYDAVNKYKKKKYKYVIMDLFIPTEREGFMLLTELKKLSKIYGAGSIIGVITASPKKEMEQQCRARGVDFFIEKKQAWQEQLYQIMDKYINVKTEDESTENQEDEEDDF